MLKVVIDSADFDTKSGTSRRGSAYSIREQVGYCHAGKEVFKITIALGKDQAVYAVGTYEVADESFTKGQFGSIAVDRLVLKPLRVAQPGAQVGPQARSA